ncbi:hypothetical protein JQC92_22165 [Shewanella sp. 202IG2-18]|uniref:hypothetical protein n=1 Tax=Parashewanella hymeniacidonis TaxID=2807618 RepID=UPI0019605D2E|nr:hypothetical protein [Parashewanella hymeniacidonis]MBM7074681.1 hypothetical protein [Parashewanella hymeniacidonis]
MLIISGIIIGQLFNFEGDTLERIAKVLSSLASIATVVGAIVATIALTSWRAQYTHTKLDKLMDELEDSFSDLFRTIHQYRFNQIMVVKYETNSGSPSDYKELKKLELGSQGNYFKAREIYHRKYEQFTRHYFLKNTMKINPHKIDQDIVPIYQGLRNIYTQDDIRESNRLLCKNDDDLELIWTQCKHEFEQVRSQALLIRNSS